MKQELLKNITTKIGSGATPRGGKEAYKEEGLTLVRSMNVFDFKFKKNGLAFIDEKQAKRLNNVTVAEKDILLNITGASVARCCMMPNDLLPARVNQHVCIIRADKSKVNPNYLLYFLNSPKYKQYLLGIASAGATREALTKETIENLKIYLPPLPIQNKIADILTAYDDLIENNNQRIRILEETAAEIYREWFVRFRFPGWKETRFLDKKGEVVEAGTEGALPEGWEHSQLKKHVEYFRGKSYSSANLREKEGLPMLNLKNFKRGGGFRRNGLKYFEGKYNEKNIAFADDIILAVTDMTQNRELVGRVARVPEMGFEKFIFSMDLVRIEPIKLSKTFCYAMLRYSDIGLKLKEFANGANVLHLNPELIYFQKAIVPTSDLCEKYEAICKPIFEETEILEVKNTLLRQTRDLLLPRLISGKLQVEATE